MLVLLAKAYHWRGSFMRTAGQRWLKCLHACTGARACLRGRAGVHYSALLAEAAYSSEGPFICISLVYTMTKVSPQPLPLFMFIKKYINKISKEKHDCISICIMEAPKWQYERWEIEPSRKTLPIWTSIPLEVSGVLRCNGTELATV